MITPQEIKDKAERKYFSFLQALASDVPFAKLVIRGDKSYTKSSLPDFEKEIQLINSQSKEKNGFGYSLEFQQIKTKYLGIQDLPVLIYFETEKDFLRFLDKENEAELFKICTNKIVNELPELRNWVIQNPAKVVQNRAEWTSILKVCQYFKENSKPNKYIRELPINVHTKFIERNQSILKELLDILIPESIIAEERQFEKRFNLKYSESQIRFKILDKRISQNLFSGIEDLAIPVSQFELLNLPIKKVLIVENKTTLYTTLTLPKMDEAIAVFGQGNAVVNIKNSKWLSEKEILYWGDLDVQGFEILSRLRDHFTHVKSVLMDKITFDAFFENDRGILSNTSMKLNLTDQELELYNMLKTNNWRLEQEKVPFNYVTRYFLNL